MFSVELIYDPDCPNVKDARTQLSRAFTEIGLSPQWQEWNRSAPESPAYVRAYGSPTILVNGYDVDDTSPSAGADCCRLYADDSGHLRKVPSVTTIAAALTRAKETALADAGETVQQKKEVTPNMSNKRKIEVFHAGCPACEETVDLIDRSACPSCEVLVLDMKDPGVASRAKSLGLRSVPAVVIDGKLTDCCVGKGPDESTLRAAGLGQPLP